ncbi:cobalt-precorrin-5B (C(1))-methyltransferase CbiD [Schwartzia succinivorans]|uniref:Cobalt-precorrin-5B C(1)-methyltransferase n=1 Tax=Schwartzia succinivorans DSM 10502 TaxID=1123243 RepID=A0A1M4VAD2_9FIRM|nr:cobalt-precorrin-5B (C(1))-methyltransferase CbiD [Schwartzia succinivorans]SHE65935.1 cobalt-precorrin 5B C1-methyltransferase [Schwartzia succinivorans DSM 10502]
MAKELRGGYTTGACMAAGVKAALLYEKGEKCDTLELKALDDTILTIPVKAVRRTEEGICAEIIKDAGDDPDITNGVSVFTTVRHLPQGSGLVFRAGEGIGTVTKPGLSVPVGEPSINPGPRKLTQNVVEEVLGVGADLEVTVSIPAGKELCKQTLNPVLGVVGGISVVGTTGVLRPMSEEGFKNSLVPQIDVALAAGLDTQVFVPGKIGETLAVKHGIPKEAIVQTSNFIGFMLEAAAERGVKRVLLFGHIGKLAKVAAGVFYTHNRIGDARLEAIGAYAAAAGMPAEGIQRILNATTTEDALTVLEEYKYMHVCNTLAERASARAERFIFNKLTVGTVLATMQGTILGMDEHAKEMGRDFHWDIE